MIYFNCPNCRKRLEAIEEWSDLFCTCPECGTEMVVPRRPMEKEETTSVTVADEQPTTSIEIKGESVPTASKTEVKTEVKTEEPKTVGNDEVISETKFLLDHMKSVYKDICKLIIALSAIFCIAGILTVFNSEDAKMVGIIMAVFSPVLGFALCKCAKVAYRLKRVYWLLMLGIYTNTKKA